MENVQQKGGKKRNQLNQRPTGNEPQTEYMYHVSTIQPNQTEKKPIQKWIDKCVHTNRSVLRRKALMLISIAVKYHR